jgi:hypothetical protein
MGRKREKKITLLKNKTRQNNLIEDIVGNEENGYQVPDHKKTMINFTNESGEDPKIPSKKNHGRDY